MESWIGWRAKIIELSKKEAVSRSFIKKLLTGIRNSEAFPYPDGTYMHAHYNCYIHHIVCMHMYAKLP